MIQNKRFTKAGEENVCGSFVLGPVENNPACEGCMYYALLGQGNSQKACHYILIHKHSRPCDPGAGCTAKVLGEYPGYDPSDWCHTGKIEGLRL